MFVEKNIFPVLGIVWKSVTGNILINLVIIEVAWFSNGALIAKSISAGRATIGRCVGR